MNFCGKAKESHIMPVNKSNKSRSKCGATPAIKGLRVMWHAGKEVNIVITDIPETNGDGVAARQFAEKRELLTQRLGLRMSEERAARDNSNKALRALRAAESATKKAAEELGEHSQKQLAL